MAPPPADYPVAWRILEELMLAEGEQVQSFQAGFSAPNSSFRA